MGARSSSCCTNSGCCSRDVDSRGVDEITTLADHPAHPILYEDALPEAAHPILDEDALPEVAGHVLNCSDDAPLVAPILSQQSPGTESNRTPSHWSEKSVDSLQHSGLLASLTQSVQCKEWGAAEMILLRALDELCVDAQKELWESIANEPVVQEILRHAKMLLAARLTLAVPANMPGSGSIDKRYSAAALGFPGWHAIPPIAFDMRTLFPDAPADYASVCDTTAVPLWRIKDDVLSIKVVVEIPSKHPTLPKAWAVAMASMLSEVDIIDFIPTYTEKPEFLEKAGLDFATWREQVRIRFILSEVSILQMTRMFTSEGVCVLASEKVWDESDDRRKQVRVPKGYTLSPGRDTIYYVFVLGERHFSFIYTNNIPLLPGQSVPSWILKIIFGWLLPTVIRKMLQTLVTIFSDPEYARRQEIDETGLYSRILKAEEDGKKRERETGRTTTIHFPQQRPHQRSFSMGGLAERIASFSSNP